MILTNSQLSNESLSLGILQSLDPNKLFKILDYIRKDNCLRYSLEIGVLKNKGYHKQIHSFLLDMETCFPKFKSSIFLFSGKIVNELSKLL